MNKSLISHVFRTACLVGAWCALPSQVHASEPLYPDLTYTVTLNLSSLNTDDSNGPFSLDLQLVTGSGSPGITNTVTLSNFVFTGGTDNGSSDYTNGNESGSLASTLVLTTGSTPVADNANEFAEAFSTGVTQISFKVDQTVNSEVVTSGTPIPDQFNVSILDSDLSNVPTTDPSGAAADTYTLLSSTITSSETNSQIDSYTLTSAPEPSVYGALALGMAMLSAIVRFRRRASFNL